MQRLIKEIVASMKCAVCGSDYQAERVHVIAQQGDLLVARVTCPECSTQGLIFATMKAGEPSSIGELDPEEWEAFGKMPKLTVDDVLDMHLLLRDYQGDMKELLKT